VAGRRGFLKTCAAAAAAGVLGPLGRAAGEPGGGESRDDSSRQGEPKRDESKGGKVRVAVVFLSNSADREMWPYPGFDTEKRHKEVLEALGEGCPQVEFTPVVVAAPADLEKAAALKDSVDGYLVYCVTLNWPFTGFLAQIGKLGKPTLVADEFLGGCGMFLVGYAQMRRQGIAAGAVSSTRLEDVVAVAKLFAGIRKPGATAESFARECEAAYRKTFPAAGEMKCREDKLALTGTSECVARLKRSRFLIVGAGKAGEEQEFLGAKGIHVGFDELKAFYDKADPGESAEWAKRWSGEAEKVFDCRPEAIVKAGAVYLAMKGLLEKYGTDSITMNCLGGFNAGELPAYPCLGFMQIFNDGGQGVCEAMPDDSVSVLMARILTGRPGYVSDPALDTSKNHIVYAHCMATSKVFGPAGERNKYRIRTLHNLDPRGTCPQSFLPEGYMTTTFRTNVAAKKMVIHQAKAVGNLDADRGCRVQLVGEVRGDIGKLFHEWDLFGWHRVTVYGDVKEPLLDLAKASGLEVIQEA
jgi:hypothetical protein